MAHKLAIQYNNKTEGSCKMQKVIVICGPTASGKTALSVELAKKINGEIVSCDSMQIYDEMQIGTARVTNDEMQGIKHYMVGMVKPTKRYSVSEYKKEAEKARKAASIAAKIAAKQAAKESKK